MWTCLVVSGTAASSVLFWGSRRAGEGEFGQGEGRSGPHGGGTGVGLNPHSQSPILGCMAQHIGSQACASKTGHCWASALTGDKGMNGRHLSPLSPKCLHWLPWLSLDATVAVLAPLFPIGAGQLRIGLPIIGRDAVGLASVGGNLLK